MIRNIHIAAKLLFMVIIMLWSTLILAQPVAPGELTRAHEKLSKDCGKCHEKNAGPSKEKCFSCHKTIAGDLQNKRGYHGRQSADECRVCHAEHNGKDYQLIPLEPSKFDHSETDFMLTGVHRTTACEKCHKQKKYSEASSECRACHKSPHDAKLKLKCDECHRAENAWTTIEYAHKEKELFVFHSTQPCTKCHVQKKFYTTSTNCISCHADYHKGSLGQDCYRCHRHAAWRVSNFDHDDSGFPLMGAHLALECGDCHRDLQSYRIVPRPTNCISCHEKDYRTAPFRHATYGAGIDCQECHLQDQWKYAHSPFWFNLQTGHHAGTSCQTCHKIANNYINYTCHDCHAGHSGDNGGRCLDCHPSGFPGGGQD